MDGEDEESWPFARCRNCGDEDVTWQQSKSGGWFLADILADGTLSHVPHFVKCQQDWRKQNPNALDFMEDSQ